MTRNDKLKELNIKYSAYYFNDVIIINDFSPKDIKVDTKSYKDVLIFFTRYEALDGVKSLHIKFTKINGYIEDHNRSKYLTLVPVDEKKS